MSTVKNYTNLADIKEFWKTDIAPNYFDFDNVNNYSLGNFGFINEVMGTAMEDGQNAINIARREFYPISAKYDRSFFLMAGVQKIDLPMATPSTCNAILILAEDLVIEKGTVVNGVNQFVIDNSINIIADKLNFMLDYPIVILSVKGEDGIWSHTTHYDINVENSLSTTTSKYISNKRTRQNGANYIYLAVQLHQVKMTPDSKTITVNSAIQSVVMEFDIPNDGQLANFEVKYVENDNSNPVQLKKLITNQTVPKVPFCYYNLIGKNKIRITIPKNIYFTPRMNSRIDIDIYTTEGSDGNFDSFEGSLVCEVFSDEYMYNNSVIITGIIDGPAINGKDTPSAEEFKAQILDAYATNNTFTNPNDLQVYFNALDRGTDTKMVIKKKRDDFRWRLYCAFCLMRDSAGEIIPSNTLDLNIAPEQFDVYYQSSKRMILKPGSLFKYSSTGDGYSLNKVDGNTIIDELDELAKDDFLFTNPFLISVTLDPNVVGYYLNSVDLSNGIEYSYVNDKSFIQFIANNFHITRNAISGENFYKLSLAVSPSTDVEYTDFIEDVDTEAEENIIRAANRGYLNVIQHDGTTVYATIIYEDGTTEKIQVGSNIVKSDTGYNYVPGYTLEFEVGDEFQKGTVLARKKVTDKGKVRVIGDIASTLLDDGNYVPFTIEAYNAESNYFTMSAYLSTNDYVSINKTVLLDHGVWNAEGRNDINISVPIEDFNIDLYAFYLDDTTNYTHQYKRFDYFGEYTLTNTYKQRDDNSLRFMKPLSVVRGHVNFLPKSITVENPSLETDSEEEMNFNYDMEILTVPVIKAEWAKIDTNTKQLIQSIYVDTVKLEEAKRQLEDSYTFHMMFFNSYGKSRYFKVGIRDELTTLDSVNCSMSFGIKLNSVSAAENTMSDIRKYIKSYVESINDVDSSGKSIFIMNLISEVKSKFSEIDYMEYYGFNTYDYSAQKIQGPTENEITEADAAGTYIPEFININNVFDGFMYQPDINLLLLN